MRSIAGPLSFAVVLIAACHGMDPVAKAPPHDDRRYAPGSCAPASVATGESCPHRKVPASNASSPEGCKSDSECKYGMNGRCIKTGYGDPSGQGSLQRNNLLGEAPPPPPRTVCVYDQCFADADCPPKQRCACGTDPERNRCIALDQCTTDHDCGPDHQCQCAASNYCVGGNCRTDADCPSGLPCRAGGDGAFCRTPADTCHADSECPPAPGQISRCGYTPAQSRWECRLTPLPPPG
jgi:hypothetical protein